MCLTPKAPAPARQIFMVPLPCALAYRILEDDVTDRSERFLAAEFLREKVFRMLGEELPYGMTVEIEKFETEGALRRARG